MLECYNGRLVNNEVLHKRPVYTGDFCRSTQCNFCRAEAQAAQALDVNKLFITDTVTQSAIYRIDLYPNYA